MKAMKSRVRNLVTSIEGGGSWESLNVGTPIFFAPFVADLKNDIYKRADHDLYYMK